MALSGCASQAHAGPSTPVVTPFPQVTSLLAAAVLGAILPEAAGGRQRVGGSGWEAAGGRQSRGGRVADIKAQFTMLSHGECAIGA
jgi:hypothetical protein